MATSRYDAFIIWGHGLPYISEIMVILRSRFKIIVILRKTINDIRGFVDEVYSTDTYPINLIREKTEYLLSRRSEAVLVLVKNDNVDLWDVDMGKYAKKECRYIAKTKVIIREKWNEHPHHHVIHGTDNESQANHLLRMFGGGVISYYISNKPFPYHVAPFEYDEVELDLRDLYGNIAGDLWMRKIEFTPQYLYAIDNKEPYEDYIKEHYGKILVEDHFPEVFDQMIEDYYNGCKFPPILVIGDKIIDGGHRCAIMASNGDFMVKALRRKEEPKVAHVRKRILLIGGTGGVGQSLLGAFDIDKYEVVAIGSKDLDVTKDIDYEKYGDPEVVVLLSSILERHPTLQQTKRMIEVNCMGAVNVLGFIPGRIPHKYGRVILMSSVFSEIDIDGYGVYSASKAFIDRLVRSSALENVQHGITVNSIQLGYTGVGMGETDKKTKNRIMKKVGVGRFVSPVEIASTITYIIDTEYLTGQNIRLDGGIR